MYSLIIPVYKNESCLRALLEAIQTINASVGGELETIFVVDGSPDNSFDLLQQLLPQQNLTAKIIAHSRNFGSFAAIRTGMAAASGAFMAVMAADLQEPPELVIEFFQKLREGNCDVVVGARAKREDPFFTRSLSSAFWGLYRRFIVKEIPSGGVDMFGCNRKVAEQLLQLDESHSSLVSLLFWIGFRRDIVYYHRQPRHSGTSAWTFSKKFAYFMNSIFAFTDWPIQFLLAVGVIGVVISFGLISAGVYGKISGMIEIKGYAALIVTISFFGALNILGMGILGVYIWRTYENTKRRPSAIVMSQIEYRNQEKL